MCNILETIGLVYYYIAAVIARHIQGCRLVMCRCWLTRAQDERGNSASVLSTGGLKGSPSHQATPNGFSVVCMAQVWLMDFVEPVSFSLFLYRVSWCSRTTRVHWFERWLRDFRVEDQAHWISSIMARDDPSHNPSIHLRHNSLQQLSIFSQSRSSSDLMFLIKKKISIFIIYLSIF